MGELCYYLCKVRIIPDVGKPRRESIIIQDYGITEVEKVLQEYLKDSVDVWEITSITKTGIDKVIKKDK